MSYDKIILKDTLKRKKKLPARAGTIQPPIALEVAYSKDLRGVIAEVLEAYKDILFPRLKTIEGSIDKSIPTNNDAGEGELIAILGRVRLVLGQKISVMEMRKIAKKNLEKTESYNLGAAKRQIKRVSGVDIVGTNAQVESTITLATANNVTLINGLVQESAQRVEQIVYEGFRQGLRWESMVEQIESQLDPDDGPVASRARRIARDQTSKLNGQLTESRQTGLGITHYIWRTSGDERVRDSHAALEGERFAWDDPPAIGHPGQDINCLISGTKTKFTHNVVTAFKRYYAGPVVKITDESGVSVTVTPNHPILTFRGWVAAKELKSSDELLHCLVSDMLNILDAKIDNDPASADDIFNLLSVAYPVKWANGANIQFHGDGANAEVMVIDAVRGLPNWIESGQFKNLKKLILSDPHLAEIFLFRDCTFFEGLNRLFASLGCSMSSLNLKGSGELAHLGPLKLLGLGRASDAYARLKESRPYNISTSFKMFCDSILTHPLLIESANFRDVHVFAVPGCSTLFKKVGIAAIFHDEYFGPVFNFHTESEFYLAEGLLVHNCRCTAEPDLSSVFD